MGESWEEALDLDDSQFDLPLKRPFQSLRRCSSSQNTSTLPSQSPSPPPHRRLIPGPAGALQSAMLRRRINHDHENAVETIISTQEYVRRAVEDGVDDDDDFTLTPWLRALEFVRLQGLIEGDGVIGIPLSAIKRWNSLDKVTQVVAIVKCCTLNGHGDMMVTLKDPTGMINATIHRRVLTETEFGKDISVGAVMIVQKVAVFSPSRSARYLNITHCNVIKVIPKDNGGPMEQNCYAPTVKHAAPASESNTSSWMAQKPSTFPRGKTEGIMSNLRKDVTRGSSHHQHRESDKPTGHNCNNDRNNKNQNAVNGKEFPVANQDVTNGSKDTTNGTDENDEPAPCERLKPSTQLGRGNVLGSTPDAAANSDNTGNNHDRKRQPLSSCVSLPQWTDEQLDELFAFD